ncbi:hypothetical protein LUZ60_015467 [Juncus effusus]|nr:hypothetical protein LUZ60_015467 [Juncus effusus]
METDAKATSSHRSAVLQVIGIVPALTASTADDLWPSHGFYLQLSDSVHSTYVSLSTHDADSVLSTRSQLGQLVHVDRFVAASPVPKAAGLRPVPASKPHPFIGSPEPLVVHRSPSRAGFVIQPASPNHQAPPLLPSSKSKQNIIIHTPKENLIITPQLEKKPSRRRSASPAPNKLSNSNSNSHSNSNSNSNSNSSTRVVRSASPVPSKCVVPSLEAAKEENRRVAKEAAIVVPSRYRQPSPAGGRKGVASPAGRRPSVSPGRRLSGVFKMSPAQEKKRAGTILGASRSVRRSWDDSSIGSAVSVEGKERGKGRTVRLVDKNALIRTQVAMARRLSDVTNEQLITQNGSEKEKPKPVKNSEPKIAVHDPKWTDGSVSLDAVSDSFSKLGKEAMQRRDVASNVAAEALQEALITESIIRNLSKFSELAKSSKPTNPIPTIDQFLSIYTDLQKWRKTIESKTEISNFEKSTSVWVEAALATDLQVVQLVQSTLNPNPNSNISKRNRASDKLDPPKMTKRQPLVSNITKGQIRVSPNPNLGNSWVKNMGEMSELVRAVRCEMQNWFLKFVEEALELGFVLIGEKEKGGNSGKITAILSEFKKINDWLDGICNLGEEEGPKEKIERLKRKIYGFVISHVGSEFDCLVNIS